MHLSNYYTKFKKEHILLFFVLLLAIFFRFYNTPNRYGFDNDPTRDSLIIHYTVTHFQFPLTGAASGIAPFTFGPWYYYQLILFRMIFPFAYAPWMFIGITSVLAVFVMYKIGLLLENKWFGILLAFFMAITPSETGQTQGLSNPNLVPLYATLVIWIFIRLFKYQITTKWVLLWGLLLGIGINIHYQMVCLLILPILLFAYRRKKIFLNVFFFTIGLAVAFLPMLAFNVLHNWHTLHGVIYYITTGRHGTYIPNNWKIYLLSFWLPYWSYILGVQQLIGILLLLFTFCIFAINFFKKQIHPVYYFLLAAFLFDFIFLRYFLSQRDYYYYLFLHAFIFIFFGYALWQLSKLKFGVIGLVIIILIVLPGMIQGDIQRLQTRPEQLTMKSQAISILQSSPKQIYSLYICNDKQKNTAQGVLFFLTNFNALDENNKGTPVGIFDDSCTKQQLTLQKKKIAPNTFELPINTKKITQAGLHLISPKTVYHDTVDWWE